MATLIIKNSAHDGYRRAGRAFARGDNRLPLEGFTQEQITALENDPHLVVAVEADDSEIELAIRLGQAAATGSENHVEATPGADTAQAHGDTAAEAATPAPAGEAVPAATAAKPRAPRGTKAKTE